MDIQEFVYRSLRDAKRVIWVGSSLVDLRGFPARARHLAGYEIFLVQQGMAPSDWKPMPSVGPGVREIRIHSGNEYRVLFIASFEEGVYVLHSFVKKTQKTSRADIDIGRARCAELMQSRARSWR